MKRHHTFLAVATVAGLLVVAVPTRQSGGEDSPPNRADGSEDDLTLRPTTGIAMPVQTGEQMERQRIRRDSLEWGRDPFEDPSPPVLADRSRDGFDVEAAVLEAAPEPRVLAASRPLQLTGISRSGKRRWAIIDRKIVQEGDALPSGHRISRIDEHTVTVMLDREAVVLNMGSQR